MTAFGELQHSDADNAGKGFVLRGLAIGLLTGLALYGIVEHWIDGRDDDPFAFTTLFFITTAAAAYLLLAPLDAAMKTFAAAAAIAAVFVIPDLFIFSALAGESDLTPFPGVFWLATRGIAAYLLTALVKTALETGLPPTYARLFFHGLTMPLIAIGAGVFALLALLLLFTWARLLKELDVGFFNALFQEPWFLLPFLGAIGGLSVALMRQLQSVLSALRFVLLFLARILIMIMAVFTVTLMIVFAAKGTDVVFAQPYPGAIMLALAIAGMLVFNGIYQNGEGTPPPLWLRIPALVTLIGFPVYALLAFYAFSLRIDAYGLTPPRIAGLVVNALVAAYSLVCIAGLATEAKWRARRWMPLVGPLNTLMAAAWVAALIVIASPLANPWALSARSQYALLAEQRIAAQDFDFAYLRFSLGRDGARALDRLEALESHPEIAVIREEIARVRAAPDAWTYRHGGQDGADASPDTRPDDIGANEIGANNTGPDNPA